MDVRHRPGDPPADPRSAFEFRVYRRGNGIVIKGRVPVSERHQKPFLERRSDVRTLVRAFTLSYRATIPKGATMPTGKEIVEYVMPEIGPQVNRICIHVPGSEEPIEIKATNPVRIA